MNRTVSVIYNNFVREIFLNYLFFISRIKLVSFPVFLFVNYLSYVIVLILSVFIVKMQHFLLSLLQ